MICTINPKPSHGGSGQHWPPPAQMRAIESWCVVDAIPLSVGLGYKQTMLIRSAMPAALLVGSSRALRPRVAWVSAASLISRGRATTCPASAAASPAAECKTFVTQDLQPQVTVYFVSSRRLNRSFWAVDVRDLLWSRSSAVVYAVVSEPVAVCSNAVIPAVSYISSYRGARAVSTAVRPK